MDHQLNYSMSSDEEEENRCGFYPWSANVHSDDEEVIVEEEVWIEDGNGLAYRDAESLDNVDNEIGYSGDVLPESTACSSSSENLSNNERNHFPPPLDTSPSTHISTASDMQTVDEKVLQEEFAKFEDGNGIAYSDVVSLDGVDNEIGYSGDVLPESTACSSSSENLSNNERNHFPPPLDTSPSTHISTASDMQTVDEKVLQEEFAKIEDGNGIAYSDVVSLDGVDNEIGYSGDVLPESTACSSSSENLSNNESNHFPPPLDTSPSTHISTASDMQTVDEKVLQEEFAKIEDGNGIAYSDVVSLDGVDNEIGYSGDVLPESTACSSSSENLSNNESNHFPPPLDTSPSTHISTASDMQTVDEKVLQQEFSNNDSIIGPISNQKNFELKSEIDMSMVEVCPFSSHGNTMIMNEETNFLNHAQAFDNTQILFNSDVNPLSENPNDCYRSADQPPVLLVVPSDSKRECGVSLNSILSDFETASNVSTIQSDATASAETAAKENLFADCFFTTMKENGEDERILNDLDDVNTSHSICTLSHTASQSDYKSPKPEASDLSDSSNFLFHEEAEEKRDCQEVIFDNVSDAQPVIVLMEEEVKETMTEGNCENEKSDGLDFNTFDSIPTQLTTLPSQPISLVPYGEDESNDFILDFTESDLVDKTLSTAVDHSSASNSINIHKNNEQDHALKLISSSGSIMSGVAGSEPLRNDRVITSNDQRPFKEDVLDLYNTDCTVSGEVNAKESPTLEHVNSINNISTSTCPIIKQEEARSFQECNSNATEIDNNDVADAELNGNEKEIPNVLKAEENEKEVNKDEESNVQDRSTYLKRILKNDIPEESLAPLPDGWIGIVHCVGLPCYYHKSTKVLTWSRPYVSHNSEISKIKKQEVPLLSIPCLKYLKTKEALANQEKEDPKPEGINSTTAKNDTNSSEGTPLNNSKVGDGGSIASESACPIPPVIIHNNFSRSLGEEELLQYLEKRFDFVMKTMSRFRSWTCRRKSNQHRITQNHQEEEEEVLPKIYSIPGKVVNLTVPRGGSGEKPYRMSFNPSVKSMVGILHEYTSMVMKIKPEYHFSEIENAINPFHVALKVGGKEYGSGCGATKRSAKNRAALEAMDQFVPGFKDQVKSGFSENASNNPFGDIPVDDPRVYNLCARSGRFLPHDLLTECLKRYQPIVAAREKFEVRTVKGRTVEYTMECGKHVVKGTARNKKEGRQIASQKMLQLLHPDVKTWGELERRYGSEVSGKLKRKRVLEQEILELKQRDMVDRDHSRVKSKPARSADAEASRNDSGVRRNDRKKDVQIANPELLSKLRDMMLSLGKESDQVSEMKKANERGEERASIRKKRKLLLIDV